MHKYVPHTEDDERLCLKASGKVHGRFVHRYTRRASSRKKANLTIHFRKLSFRTYEKHEQK